MKCKSYQYILSPLEEEIWGKILHEDPTAFKDLNNAYNLSSNQLPLQFKQPHMYPTIRKYLSNFIPPESGKNGYQHLQLYSYEGCPNKSDMEVQMIELKWNLRKKKKDRYLGICNNIMNMIGNFFGDFHPYLSQLYEIFAMYHRDNG